MKKYLETASIKKLTLIKRNNNKFDTRQIKL